MASDTQLSIDKAAPRTEQTTEVVQNGAGPYIQFLDRYKIGDHIGIISFVLAIYGTWLSFKSWKAAENAEDAAKLAQAAAENALRHKARLDTASSLSDIAQQLTEIMALHHDQVWENLLERYQRVIDRLAQIEIDPPEHTQKIDGWITELSKLKSKCMSAIHKQKTDKTPIEPYVNALTSINVSVRKMITAVKLYKGQ
jgi:hypothetical protein